MKNFKSIMAIGFVIFVMTINSYADAPGILGPSSASGTVVSQMLYPLYNVAAFNIVGDVYVFTSGQYYTGSAWTAAETAYKSNSPLVAMQIVYDVAGLAVGSEVYIGYGEGLVNTYATMISNTTFEQGYITKKVDSPPAPLLDIVNYYLDADGDGYGDPNTTTVGGSTSVPTGYVADNTDCDDTNASINPAATEIPYDGIDQNCDGSYAAPGASAKFMVFYLDADGDGYGDPNNSKMLLTTAAPLGYVVDNTDCDDTNPSINPGAKEITGDGIDQNCDGLDMVVVQPIMVADDLSIYLSNIEYDAGPLFGGILHMGFTLIYDSTSGEQLWKLDMNNISYNVTGALQDVVTLNNDISFNLTDLKYDAGLLLGMYTLDVTFEYVNIVGDIIYWKISKLIEK